jgi:DNA polymerase III sliding clamp (beta) subunit (PCNA family)
MNLTFESATSLYRAIAAVDVARGRDTYRPILENILFEHDIVANTLRLVATDSYRLNIAEIPMGGVLGSRSSEPVMIGGDYKALLAMLKAAKNTAVTITTSEDGHDYVFATAGSAITMHKSEGTFPDYRQLIPAEFGNEGTAYNPKYLSDIGKAAMLFAGETAKTASTPVRLQTDLHKPGLFKTVYHETGELQQLLMPVRVS